MQGSCQPNAQRERERERERDKTSERSTEIIQLYFIMCFYGDDGEVDGGGSVGLRAS